MQWDSYEEADWASFPLMHASNPGGLSDSVDPGLVDDWIGVAFDQYAVVGLPAGDSTTVKVTWVFGAYAGLTLGANPDSLQTGGTVTVTATSLAQGRPLVGAPVRYTVTGANPSSGTAVIGPTGTTQFNLTGANAGTDTVTAFADANNNSAFDPDTETQRSVTVAWTSAPPPPPPPPPPTGPTADQIAAQLQATLKRFGALLRNKSPKVLLRTPAPHADHHALEAGTLTATLRGQKATGSAARASVLATARVTFAAAGTKRVTLHATKKGRKLLRRAKRIKATVTLAFAPPSGALISRHASVALRRP
jgi:hypothetical protein